MRSSGAKRRKRETIIAKALLLGYTISPLHPSRNDDPAVKKPDGSYLTHFVSGSSRGWIDGPYIQTFDTVYAAALAALKHAGVFNAKKSRRDIRAHSRKSDRLRKR